MTLAVLVLLLHPSVVPAQTTWVKVVPDVLWTGSYRAVAVPAPSTVFVAGDQGKMMRSRDAGASWESIPTGVPLTIRNMIFSDTLLGMLVGDFGLVLRTTDGGVSWSRPVSGTGVTLRDVAGVSGGCWVIPGDSNTILRSTDDGIHWLIGSGPLEENWLSASFVSGLEGVAVGEGGSIIRTTDGGSTWSLVHSTWPLKSVAAAGGQLMVAVGYAPWGSRAGNVISISRDGGTTWSDSLDGTDWRAGLVDVAFASERFGYGIGIGDVERIQDGARSFTSILTVIGGLNAIAFNNPRSAFIAADGGFVLRLTAARSISGSAYLDANGDSVRSGGEEALAGRQILLAGPLTDSATTGPDGTYAFSSLPYGDYRVFAEPPLYWDRTEPDSSGGYQVAVRSQPTDYAGLEFGFAGPLYRLRIPIQVQDNTSFANRTVVWGVRPGASKGIWLTDPRSTIVDSLEGEGEIPPRSFTETVGLFDARLSDPALPLNSESPSFGQGSWTDARDFTSRVQSDTFLVSFLPAYRYGGGYPMTLGWQGQRVAESFDGTVTMTDPGGNSVDMKSTDRLIVSDTTVESVVIIAERPHLPASWLPSWRLISIPLGAGSYPIESLFHSATSPGYAYSPVIGYEPRDTMSPEMGYWVKLRPAAEKLVPDASARLRDTIPLVPGWNVIPSLTVPLGAASLQTVPPGILSKEIFGFADTFFPAETLLPGNAYWVRATSAGEVILDTSISPTRPSAPPVGDREGERGAITVEDAEGNIASVYYYGDGALAEGSGELPPQPPVVVLDFRYENNRYAEGYGGKGQESYTLLLTAARYPVTMSWDCPASSPPVALSIGGSMQNLAGTGSIQIYDAVPAMTLTLGEAEAVPQVFELRQNYPNPANPSTRIDYSLPVASKVIIRVYDVLGRSITTLVDGVEDPGNHFVDWNPVSLPTGIYFYRMEAVSAGEPAERFIDVKTLTLIR